MVYSATKSLLLSTIWLNSIVTYGKSNTTVLNMTHKFFLTWEILKNIDLEALASGFLPSYGISVVILKDEPS